LGAPDAPANSCGLLHVVQAVRRRWSQVSGRFPMTSGSRPSRSADSRPAQMKAAGHSLTQTRCRPHRLHLLLATPEEHHLRPRSRCGCFLFLPDQTQSSSRTRSRHILVDQQWTSLVGDHRVQRACVPEIRQRHGPAIVAIRYPTACATSSNFPAPSLIQTFFC